tara:strand:- start:196 stop:864 length:669 start_codon:yes stop_codon:yes gene_type:complete
MAGRVTYKNPESHNDGGWVSPLKLKKRTEHKIEKLIDRQLADKEIASICAFLARIKSMKTRIGEVKNQDIKRTLASFSRLSSRDATMAYRESDSITQAIMDETLLISMGINLYVQQDKFIAINVLGENIKKAAKIAYESFSDHPKRSSGRPIKGYLRILAVYTLNLWMELGMKPCRPWQHPDYDPPATPIVLLMEELKICIDGVSIDYKEAVLLLKEAEKRR